MPPTTPGGVSSNSPTTSPTKPFKTPLKLTNRDREMYFLKAQKAQQQAENKVAAVLLRRIQPFTSTEQYHLLTMVTFDLWIESRGTANEDNFADDCIAAYSDYFRDVADSEIHVFEYIKLSQLYIFKGALEGALAVLKVASTKGHLTSTIVVLQSWSILTRIDTVKESEKYINFLASAVSLENRDHREDGDYVLNTCKLKLKYLYLFCCMRHVWGMQKTLDDAEKREHVRLFNALLTEVYVFYNKNAPSSAEEAVKWFNDKEIWWNMGLDLLTTPFLLLAEDALWESFLRDSCFDERSLIEILSCLKNTQRYESSSRSLIEKAYNVNPWNLFVRQWLSDNDINQHWHRVYLTQNFLLSKVQGCIRGWSLRRNFEPIRQLCLYRLKIFHDKMNNAKNKYGEIQTQRLHDMLRLWRSNARFLKILRFKSTQTIQKRVRRNQARVRYIDTIQKVNRANASYLVAISMLHSKRRKTLLKGWHKFQMLQVRNRAADILAAIITINGNSKKFLEGCDMLCRILSVSKKFSRKKTFAKWRDVYIRKIMRSARVSIRFQIRNLWRKREEERKAIELAATEAKMKKLQMQSEFVPSPYQTFRKFWAVWRKAYIDARALRLTKLKVKKFCADMRRVHARNLDHKAILRRRTRKEIETAFTLSCRYKNLYTCFRYWQIKSVVLKLQRAIRIFLSRCRYLRRFRINVAINENKEKRDFLMYKRTMFKIRKFLFLQHREQIRASLLLTKTFRMWGFKKRIRYNLERKICASNFSNTLASIMNKYLLQVLRWRTNYIFWEQSIGAVFDNVYRKCLTQGFNAVRWAAKHQKRREHQLHMIEEMNVLYKINATFWPQAYKTVHYTNHIQHKAGYGLYLWEHLVSTHEVRRDDLETLWTAKAFRVMIAVYRDRMRKRRNAIRKYSIRYFDKYVIDTAVLRQYCRIILSSWMRGILSRNYTSQMVQKDRQTSEIGIKLKSAKNKAVFRFIHVLCVKRQQAASEIRHWFRYVVAKRKVERKKRSNNLSILNERYVKKKEEMRLLRKYLRKMKCTYGICLGSYNDHSMSRYFALRNESSSASSKIVITGDMSKLEGPKSVNKPLKISKKASRILTSKSTPNLKSSTKSKYDEFQSVEFYNHLFKIKKSGIFSFNGNEDESLSDNELIYCTKGADVLFCPNVTDNQLSKMLPHFNGRKIVLCGGRIGLTAVQNLIKFLAESIVPHGLSLTLNNLEISCSDLNQFFMYFKFNYLYPMKELSVDMESLGILGVSTFIATMSENTTLERLFLDLTGGDESLQIMDVMLSNLQHNRTLQELHVVGVLLEVKCVRSLRFACRNGLNALKYLKFGCQPDAIIEAEMLIEMSKDRARMGKGMSIDMFDI